MLSPFQTLYKGCLALVLTALISMASVAEDWEWRDKVEDHTNIQQDVRVSPSNSSTAKLNSGLTFTGTAVSTLGVNAIQVNFIADQNATVYVDQSNDGTNWDIVDSYKFYTTLGGIGVTTQATASYLRVRVTNTSAANMTYLRLSTVLCPVVEAVPRSLDAAGQLKVDTQPYLQKVAEGNIPEHTGCIMQGYNPDVDNALESVWPVGGLYVFPTIAAGLEVVSSSTSDDAGSTGVFKVTVEYLDGSWVEKTASIYMDGTTVVATDFKDVYRVNRFYVDSVGTALTAVGNIDLRNLADTPIYARIPAGYNDSQQAIRTVPANKVWYIVSYSLHSGSSGTNFTEGRLRATEWNAIFTPGVFHQLDICIAENGESQHIYAVPIKIPAKTDVVVRVIANSASASCGVSAIVEGWCEIP